MSVTVFTTFQPKLKGVCPKGVGPTPSEYPYPYRGGGGGGGQNQPVEFHFFLLGNPGIVIQPLEWNCKITCLNKFWAKRKYDHGSAIF